MEQRKRVDMLWNQYIRLSSPEKVFWIGKLLVCVIYSSMLLVYIIKQLALSHGLCIIVLLYHNLCCQCMCCTIVCYQRVWCPIVCYLCVLSVFVKCSPLCKKNMWSASLLVLFSRGSPTPRSSWRWCACLTKRRWTCSHQNTSVESEWLLALSSFILSVVICLIHCAPTFCVDHVLSLPVWFIEYSLPILSTVLFSSCLTHFLFLFDPLYSLFPFDPLHSLCLSYSLYSPSSCIYHVLSLRV